MKNFFLYFLLVGSVAVLGFTLSPHTRNLMLNIGLAGETVPISGTGSMYPTFPKSEGVTDETASNQTVAQPVMKRYPSGIEFLGYKFFTYELKRGDIIEFENEMTGKITGEKYGGKTGFVKRLIAGQGDEVELRDGFVYVNGQILKEPYTAKGRSTYGGVNLADCRKTRVPQDHVFVLGDNRKASLDSRFELGFVAISDIHHVLPYEEQDKYSQNWRDAEKDEDQAHRPTTDRRTFITLLNSRRLDKKLSPLKLMQELNESSAKRGNIILSTNDFSSEATRSGLTLEKAVRESGYRNIIFAELFTRGFYEAPELIENFLEFPDTQDLLFSTQYTDIGLSAVLSDVENCPTQVVVIHLGGYKPPNYDSQDIESWEKLIDNLEGILPSWKNLAGIEQVNQEKLKRLISILEERLNNARTVYSRLSDNQWLTDAENQMVQKDNTLHNEAEKLISELNK